MIFLAGSAFALCGANAGIYQASDTDWKAGSTYNTAYGSYKIPSDSDFCTAGQTPMGVYYESAPGNTYYFPQPGETISWTCGAELCEAVRREGAYSCDLESYTRGYIRLTGNGINHYYRADRVIADIAGYGTGSTVGDARQAIYDILTADYACGGYGGLNLALAEINTQGEYWQCLESNLCSAVTSDVDIGLRGKQEDGIVAFACSADDVSPLKIKANDGNVYSVLLVEPTHAEATDFNIKTALFTNHEGVTRDTWSIKKMCAVTDTSYYCNSATGNLEQKNSCGSAVDTRLCASGCSTATNTCNAACAVTDTSYYCDSSSGNLVQRDNCGNIADTVVCDSGCNSDINACNAVATCSGLLSGGWSETNLGGLTTGTIVRTGGYLGVTQTTQGDENIVSLPILAETAIQTKCDAAGYTGTICFDVDETKTLSGQSVTGTYACNSGCTPETDIQLCQAANNQCGTITRTDSCGTSRTVDCSTINWFDYCNGFTTTCTDNTFCRLSSAGECFANLCSLTPYTGSTDGINCLMGCVTDGSGNIWATGTDGQLIPIATGDAK